MFGFIRYFKVKVGEWIRLYVANDDYNDLDSLYHCPVVVDAYISDVQLPAMAL